VDLGDLSQAVTRWAALEPLVTKAYIFGSRITGTHTSESDLDVAVELKPEPGDTTPFATWIHEAQRLRDSIAKAVPVKVDLQRYGGPTETPTIHAGLQSANRVVYEVVAQPLGAADAHESARG